MGILSEGPKTFFRLGPVAEKPECYGLRRGEVEGRISAEYYRAEFRDLLGRMRHSFPKIQGIGAYAEIICGPFGTEIKQDDYVAHGVPLLRISNITKEGTLDLHEVVFISPEKAASLATTQVVPGDIVISQRGTLGMPAVVSSEFPFYNISANLIAVRKSSDLSPRFVQLFLTSRLGERQIARLQSGQVHAKLTTDDVAAVLIPVIQDQVGLAAAMDEARASRCAKLEKADEFLSGLNAFVLDQLDLGSLPKDRRQCYCVNHREIWNSRIDAAFFRPDFVFAERQARNVRSGAIPLQSLLLGPPVNGANAREFLTSGRRYLRVQNIRPFEIVTEDVAYVGEVPDKGVNLHAGDVLLTRKGTYGVAACVAADEEDCLISSELMLLRLDPNCPLSPEFVVAWLNCSLMQTILARHSTGALMGHITQDVVSRLPVPQVSKRTQAAIVAEVFRRREGARRLRAEAEAEWQAAKIWFEEQLLGPG